MLERVWRKGNPLTLLVGMQTNCCFLIHIQVSQEAGKVGLVFPSLEEFSTVCLNPHKGFGIVHKAEVDVCSLAFSMIQGMLAL